MFFANKIKKRSIIVGLLVSLLVLLLNSKQTLSLEENFDKSSLDDNKWKSYENDGKIELLDSELKLSSNGGTFPYIYTLNNPFLEKDNFSIKIKMQYTSLHSRGGGITIGNLTPPNSCSVQYYDSHGKEIILFTILQDSVKPFRVFFVPCRDTSECNHEPSTVLKLEESNLDPIELQIVYFESRYKFFYNGSWIFTSKETPRRPNVLFIGNPTNHEHNSPWSSFSVDSIEILPFYPSSPSPSPSIFLDPIIILPGLGASWNHEDIILNEHKEPSDWYITPFVKVYDGLIQTLRNAGYEDDGENKNLFIFNYDWRQPIETTADQFSDYIENVVNPSPETKIDLIGHSLGGMVARTYAQKNSNHQIDQLVTLGSPHHGAPQVYYLWEGADFQKTLSLAWQRIGTELILQLKRKPFENRVLAIQNLIPSLKDILPTFPYLKKNGSEIPLSNMKEKNDWLALMNNLPLPKSLTDVLNNFVGLKGDTLRWIKIKDRNQFDKILGKWTDGKPIDEKYETGDLTVLAESAQLPATNVVELLDLNHGELVETTTGIQTVTDFLGLSPLSIEPAPNIVYEPSLIFQIASKANLTVFSPDGIKLAEGEKLVFISNPLDEGDYHIFVNPEDNGGIYRLLIGKITSQGDSWSEISGEVTTKSDDYYFPFSQDPKELKIELLKLTKKHLEEAKNLVQKLPRPFRFIFNKLFSRQIRRIEKIISLIEKRREKMIEIWIRQLILNLSIIENHLRIWSRFYNYQPEFKENLRMAKDYLLQAYEL